MGTRGLGDVEDHRSGGGRVYGPELSLSQEAANLPEQRPRMSGEGGAHRYEREPERWGGEGTCMVLHIALGLSRGRYRDGRLLKDR